MPTPLHMHALLGLVVASIGFLTLVLAFQVADGKKRVFSYGIAGLIVFVGLYYYVSTGMRGFQARKRIESIQRQQKVNLAEIQKRLRATAKPAEKKRKETPPPAPKKKKKRG